MIEHIILAAAIAALIVYVLPYFWPPVDTCVVTAEGIEIPVEPAQEPEWKKYLLFKKGGGSAPSPDPNIGIAAREEIQLGRQWLDFAKEQFKVGNERQEDLDALNKRVIEQALESQSRTDEWAAKDRQRYESVFQPLQDEFIETARQYDTPEKQEQMAAEARADVAQAARQAQEANTRAMASMGINPNSGRFQGISRAQDTVSALASAGAANNARQAVRDRALALKADAINLGNGLPAQAASSVGLGLNAGSAAAGTALGGEGNWRGNIGIMNQGYAGAMQGIGTGANILNQQYQNQLNAWSAQQQANASGFGGLMSGIGTFAGLAF